MGHMCCADLPLQLARTRGLKVDDPAAVRAADVLQLARTRGLKFYLCYGKGVNRVLFDLTPKLNDIVEYE